MQAPKPMKSFIKRSQPAPVREQLENSSDDNDDAPKFGNDFDFGSYEEEVVPVNAKPFLFGAVDRD
jgi:hypothetical protein